MPSTTFLSIFAFVALTAAAPAQWTDPTVCAPGTGYYQVCASGFKGCCTADACSVGYCPTAPWTPPTEEPTEVPEPTQPGTCAPGTGYYQVCSSGFKGCCEQDACSLGYCPLPQKVKARTADPTVCPPGTGYYQVCASGFKGCCKEDACSVGYCPSTWTPPTEEPETPKTPIEPSHPGTCAAGTGYYQVCGNGFKGCCKQDACSLGYCPLPQKVKARTAADPTVCAPGTGYYQVCASGFKGCCKTDACSVGYCPSTWIPPTTEPEVPEVPSVPEMPVEPVHPGTCAVGTGYYQVCGNGFKGCCKKDACSLGYCPQ